MRVSLQIEVLSYPEREQWEREGNAFHSILAIREGPATFAERQGTEYDPVITGAPLLHS